MTIDQDQHSLRSQVAQVNFRLPVSAKVGDAVLCRARGGKVLQKLADVREAGTFNVCTCKDQHRRGGFIVRAFDVRTGNLDRLEDGGARVSCRILVRPLRDRDQWDCRPSLTDGRFVRFGTGLGISQTAQSSEVNRRYQP